MLMSNRGLSCLVVIGSREPQVQTIEVHDFFMPCAKGKRGIKTHSFTAHPPLIYNLSTTHSDQFGLKGKILNLIIFAAKNIL